MVNELKDSRAEVLLYYLPVGFVKPVYPLDDIKSQLSAMVVHRVLANLFVKRGYVED